MQSKSSAATNQSLTFPKQFQFKGSFLLRTTQPVHALQPMIRHFCAPACRHCNLRRPRRGISLNRGRPQLAAGPVAFVLIFLGLLATAAGAAPNAIAPHHFIPLFNGRDLTGLRSWLLDSGTADLRRVFSVTNGLLRISGNGLGYLRTTNAYRDYRLVVEFRWGQKNWAWGNRIGKARDSGIFLHSFGPDGNSDDGNGAFRAGIECNLFQGATGDFLLIRGHDANGALLAPRLTAEVAAERDDEDWPFWKAGGEQQTLIRWGRLNWFGKSRRWRDELDFRGPHDLEAPPGEWTRIECVCRGDKITVRVNDRVANEALHVSPSEGHILLQCEGSEVFFRKFELHPL